MALAVERRRIAGSYSATIWVGATSTLIAARNGGFFRTAMPIPKQGFRLSAYGRAEVIRCAAHWAAAPDGGSR